MFAAESAWLTINCIPTTIQMYDDTHWVNYKVAFVHCISKLEVLGEHLKTLSLNVRSVCV